MNLSRQLRVLSSLFLLLIITTALAFIPLNGWNWVPNLALSFVMTGLVILFYMKIRFSEPLLKLTSIAGFGWLSLLLLLVILDYVSRPWPK